MGCWVSHRVSEADKKREKRNSTFIPLTPDFFIQIDWPPVGVGQNVTMDRELEPVRLWALGPLADQVVQDPKDGVPILAVFSSCSFLESLPIEVVIFADILMALVLHFMMAIRHVQAQTLCYC